MSADEYRFIVNEIREIKLCIGDLATKVSRMSEHVQSFKNHVYIPGPSPIRRLFAHIRHIISG